MQETSAIETDPLRALFNQVKDSLATEQEMLQNDITELVWYSLGTRVKSRECINIHVRGEVATGKSTVAMAGMLYINEKLIKVSKERLEALNKLIFSDQTEFLRWIRTKEENICIQIDEWNEMAETGYNATTETKLFDHWSDVFAQRFVHRVSCSPSGIPDRNCYLILDVEGRNLERKITRCKVTYRDIISQRECVLGFMDIDVSGILEKEWYKKYREKKFKRMELLEKEGQRDIKELEFSTIALKTFRKMSKTDTPIMYDPDMIKAYVEMTAEDEGRIYSILTVLNIAGKAKNLVKLRYRLLKTREKMEETKNEERKAKIKEQMLEIAKVYGELLDRMTRHSEIYMKWIDTE